VKLLSVNVSLPKVVAFDGPRVETGIFKKPVSVPVKVRAVNLDGDLQADLSVHGGLDKAVYVYSWKNVEYWRERLRRDDLAPGTFGENFTVDELLENEVAIGDELEIGTARFLVTQPRLPCFKLGIALGLPGFPKVFHRSGRNGFYLRVLQEGTIEAGDAIRKIESSNGGRMTIAEFVRIATSKSFTEADLDRILSLAALPRSWKIHLTEMFRARGK
jgi:MOSC domain-containing protein YiiM